jgi:hypothetical protein
MAERESAESAGSQARGVIAVDNRLSVRVSAPEIFEQDAPPCTDPFERESTD